MVKPQLIEEAIEYLTRYQNRRSEDAAFAFAASHQASYERAFVDEKNLERLIVELRKAI